MTEEFLAWTLSYMAHTKVDPHKCMIKLYERTHPFKDIQVSLLAEILNKLTQFRIVQTWEEPKRRRNVEGFHRKYERVSRILIYRRCQSKIKREKQCFPLIWDEPGTSKVIDGVSGEALRHITLLCRDMICECNKCTTGCPKESGSCDKCNLNKYIDRKCIAKYLAMDFSGSFAEDCTLPMFMCKTTKMIQ